MYCTITGNLHMKEDVMYFADWMWSIGVGISNCHRPNNANNRTSGWYCTQGNTSLQKEKPVMAFVNIFCSLIICLNCAHIVYPLVIHEWQICTMQTYSVGCVFLIIILGMRTWVMVRIVWILISYYLFDLSEECMGGSTLVQTAFNLQLYGPLFLVIHSEWCALYINKPAWGCMGGM